MSIPVPLRVNNKLSEDFYPLQKEELIALRKAKLINNAAYIHLALRYENPYCDRPVQIVPKEFALRWQIPEVSVYKAIAKLKELRVLIIKTGKLVIDWVIKSDDRGSKLELEQVTETSESEKLSDPKENYQIREKIIRSDNRLSNPRKNYQIRENRGLKPLSDIGSETLQTIQTFQTNQTQVEGGATFFQEKEQPKKEVVQETVQNQEVKEEKKLVSKNESVGQSTRDVVQEKTKIISPSKKRCDPAYHKGIISAQDALGSAPIQFGTSDKPKSVELPEDLKEKLQELEIPLSRSGLKKSAM